MAAYGSSTPFLKITNLAMKAAMLDTSFKWPGALAFWQSPGSGQEMTSKLLQSEGRTEQEPRICASSVFPASCLYDMTLTNAVTASWPGDAGFG